MKYDFKNYQLDFIKELTNIDASVDLGDAQEKKVIEKVEHELMFSFDKDDWPTETTYICESILDLIKDTKKQKKR